MPAEIIHPIPPKVCPECNEPLGPGRGDRKFCGDICRTAYNNRSRKEPQLQDDAPTPEPDYMEELTSVAITKIKRILEDNRIKLSNLYGLYELNIALNDFYAFGVNVKYFISEYTDEYDINYRMCFDYGYCIEGGHVKLVYNVGEIFHN